MNGLNVNKRRNSKFLNVNKRQYDLISANNDGNVENNDGEDEGKFDNEEVINDGEKMLKKVLIFLLYWSDYVMKLYNKNSNDEDRCGDNDQVIVDDEEVDNDDKKVRGLLIIYKRFSNNVRCIIYIYIYVFQMWIMCTSRTIWTIIQTNWCR